MFHVHVDCITFTSAWPHNRKRVKIRSQGLIDNSEHKIKPFNGEVTYEFKTNTY